MSIFLRQTLQNTGAKHAIAVVNGTCALHVALQLSGVQANEEVLVPSLSFVAVANAVRYCGAIPHFVDIEGSSLGMDPEALDAWLKQITEPVSGAFRNRQTGRRLRAMVPLHTFGHPCSMEALMKIARDYRLELLEDAAESLGSSIKVSIRNPRTVWDPQFQREQNCYNGRRRGYSDQ